MSSNRLSEPHRKIFKSRQKSFHLTPSNTARCYTNVTFSLSRFTTRPASSNNLNFVSAFRVQNQVHGQSKPAFARHALLPYSPIVVICFYISTIFHFPTSRLCFTISNQNGHVIARNLVLNVLFMWKCHQHGPSSSSHCSLSPIHTTCFPAFFDFVLLLGACFMQLFFVLPRRTKILENLAQSVFVSRAMTKTGRRAVFVYVDGHV